ncbi:IS30 family transposase [Acinetobacter sp. TGL-Y2]|uniref:IS30 family transposase n=1 Tax=Acinetobacter sp. TGL-Y2 TaxID=1407071 RepID=UPI00082B7F18|nr:IS30 family transposase [Acinetobacter sp. TGL-Y2]
MNYTHLTQEERYQIYTLLREGFSTRHIALRLARAPSTICREIKRNRNRNGYFAKHAHKLAKRRHISNHRTVSSSLLQQIESYLALQWSPEQIASHVAISMHSIYRYIQQDKLKGGSLYLHLRFRNQRKRKYGQPETRGMLSNRKSIHDRPHIIEKRSRFGDLEIDTIVGKNQQQSLVSIVDRKTGYLWLKKCSTRKSQAVCEATVDLLAPIKEKLKTITADNGKEFSLHEQIANELEIEFYFADPYSAWQRGTNENTNGLIRQYIRKGSDLNNYTDEYISEITKRLNHRPRKRLGFKSPSQVLLQEHGVALQVLI